MIRAFAAAALLAGPALAACEGGTCEIASGTYEIALPEGEGPFPAIVFLHGAGASGAAMMRMGMAGAATARGYAFIAPDGMIRPGRNSRGWAFLPAFREGRRDEAAFLREVLADAAVQGVDPERAILSGFSIGGSMASYIACEAPGDFAAYAPVGGSFWREEPEACAGPVNLFHVHGWQDTTVPLEGRFLREGIAQGDVFESMTIWRDTNGCAHFNARRFPDGGRFWRRAWTDCDEGASLEFVLHDGGHAVPRGWTDLMLDWFETLPGPGAG